VRRERRKEDGEMFRDRDGVVGLKEMKYLEEK
jgi:hypothetical protein